MKFLRLICLCVIAFVLPLNTVLAQMPAPKQTAAHGNHAVAMQHTDHHQSAASAGDSVEMHVHHGLFGQKSVHVHEPSPAVDCAKACQAMTGSLLLINAFIEPSPLSAILVAHSGAALSSAIVPPLEDPPKMRA